MVPEQLQKLLLKRNPAVMFFLLLNVANHIGPARFRDSEGTVSALPCEETAALFRPSRGVGFHHAQTIGYGKIGRQTSSKMHVIGDTANDDGDRAQLAEDAAGVGVHLRAQSVVE